MDTNEIADHYSLEYLRRQLNNERSHKNALWAELQEAQMKILKLKKKLSCSQKMARLWKNWAKTVRQQMIDGNEILEDLKQTYQDITAIIADEALKGCCSGKCGD